MVAIPDTSARELILFDKTFEFRLPLSVGIRKLLDNHYT